MSRIGIDILLPTEITMDIISRLPFDSILHCRQVCKTWRNFIHHPSFTHALHLLLRRRRQLLLDDHSAVVGSGSAAAASGKMGFIFLGKNQQGCDVNDYQSCNRGKEIHYVEYNVNDENQYCKTTPTTRINLHIPDYATFIVGSCNGLICIAFRSKLEDLGFLKDPVYICNPITRECVNLPRFDEQIDINRRPCLIRFNVDTIVSGFGYHHSTSEYKVVRIYYSVEKPTIGTVEVYTLGGSGSGKWRKKGEVTYNLREYNHSSPGIFANGALHWLDHDRSIVAFELGDEEFRLLPQAPWFHANPYVYEVKLRLFQGSLCVVRHKHGSTDIWSLKKNNEWECMFTINTRKLDTRNHCWTRMFNIDVNYETIEDYIPFAHTNTGQVLLCYRHRFFCCCNPKASTFESIVDYNIAAHSVIPHMNSFVSLRALLEEEKDGKMIASVERVARKYYQAY